MVWLVVLLVALGGVAKGGKLYIKVSGVSMTDQADGGGKKTALKAGDEVTWLGADDKVRTANAIEVGGKKGFVHVTQLTPNKPADEVAPDGKLISPQEFASRRDSAVPVVGKRDDPAVAALQELEASSEQARRKVDEHVQRAGLREPK